MSFNQALCGLYAAGRGVGSEAGAVRPPRPPRALARPSPPRPPPLLPPWRRCPPGGGDTYQGLGAFADVLAQARPLRAAAERAPLPAGSVVITGAGLGLPGGECVFGDDKASASSHGESLIDTIPVGRGTRSSTSTSPVWSRTA